MWSIFSIILSQLVSAHFRVSRLSQGLHLWAHIFLVESVPLPSHVYWRKTKAGTLVFNSRSLWRDMSKLGWPQAPENNRWLPPFRQALCNSTDSLPSAGVAFSHLLEALLKVRPPESWILSQILIAQALPLWLLEMWVPGQHIPLYPSSLLGLLPSPSWTFSTLFCLIRWTYEDTIFFVLWLMKEFLSLFLLNRILHTTGLEDGVLSMLHLASSRPLLLAPSQPPKSTHHLRFSLPGFMTISPLTLPHLQPAAHLLSQPLSSSLYWNYSIHMGNPSNTPAC